jgi:4'-phosphopantetheinyl transferase
MDCVNHAESLWQARDACPPLGPRDVHVWRVELDRCRAHVESLAASLSAEERSYASRFVHEGDRTRYITTRGALRHILGGYVSSAPETIVFSFGARGKPELSEPLASWLGFNVSHSRDIALCAVARTRRVGIDVEYLRPVTDALDIAERFFSSGESAALRAIPHERRRSAFFACWTRKEAYVKALGEGLAVPLHSFEVSLADPELARLRSIGGSVEAARGWTVCDVAPGPGYAGAVAVEGRDWAVVHCHFAFALDM